MYKQYIIKCWDFRWCSIWYL